MIDDQIQLPQHLLQLPCRLTAVEVFRLDAEDPSELGGLVLVEGTLAAFDLAEHFFAEAGERDLGCEIRASAVPGLDASGLDPGGDFGVHEVNAMAIS